MSVIITIIIIIISSQGDKQQCWNNTGGGFFKATVEIWAVSAMNAQLMAVLMDYPARGGLAL